MEEKKIKILVYGSAERGSNDLLILSSLRTLGADAEIFNDEGEFKKTLKFAGPGSIFYRFLNKYCNKFFSRQIQNFFLELAESYKPDAIFVIKGYYLSPATIKKIKTAYPGIVWVAFNPDNPFDQKKGTANRWILDSIPLFDVYFTWGKYLVPLLIAGGAKDARHINCGYDPKTHFVASATPEEEREYSADISFVGSWDRSREEWLTYLKSYNLKIYGNTWGRVRDKVLLGRWSRKAVLGRDYSLACGLSKININLLREQNLTAHNCRTFEVPACGGFMLATRSGEQEAIFPPGIGADYFSTPEEMVSKVEYYLAHEGERKKIAKTGHLLGQEYTYDLFAKTIISAIKRGK